MQDGTRNDPAPDLLCEDAHATDGVRASSRQHLVQYPYADGCFGLLRGEAACSQPRSDQRLVAAHRRFDQRPFAIICCFLPGQSSALRDHLEMPVTLCEWTLFTTEYRSRTRWDHDCDIFAVRRDRCVGGGAVVRAICCHPVILTSI